MTTSLYQVIFFATRALVAPGVKVTSHWPLAQSVHETGNFSAPAYVQGNNLHGMTKPTKRPTTAIGARPNGLAIFRSSFDSIRDYFYWLAARGITTDAQLLEYIRKPARLGGYAEDPQYFKKVSAAAADLESRKLYISESDLTLGVGLSGILIAGAITLASSK
jgi:hypothetical protein